MNLWKTLLIAGAVSTASFAHAKTGHDVDTDSVEHQAEADKGDTEEKSADKKVLKHKSSKKHHSGKKKTKHHHGKCHHSDKMAEKLNHEALNRHVTGTCVASADKEHHADHTNIQDPHHGEADTVFEVENKEGQGTNEALDETAKEPMEVDEAKGAGDHA